MIEQQIKELEIACKHYGVKELYVFRSIVKGTVNDLLKKAIDRKKCLVYGGRN